MSDYLEFFNKEVLDEDSIPHERSKFGSVDLYQATIAKLRYAFKNPVICAKFFSSLADAHENSYIFGVRIDRLEYIQQNLLGIPLIRNLLSTV